MLLHAKMNALNMPKTRLNSGFSDKMWPDCPKTLLICANNSKLCNIML